MRNFTGATDDLGTVKLLLRCKPIPKRVSFHLSHQIRNNADLPVNGCRSMYTPFNDDTWEKIREETAALFHHDTKVESSTWVDGIRGYKTFLNATSMIAKCEVLEVQVTTRRHAFSSAVLHLLRKSVGVAKLLIRLPRMGNKSCTEGCPCSLPDSCNTDKIQLDSLKEVEILGFQGEFNQMKFINLLLDCHAPILKKVYVRIPKDVKSISKTKNKKIRSIIDGHPEIDVEFKLWP
uniref:FBD domain-containing protein n=1 Tax=Oryza meridionalis TaxID=40149 RepID=A0A0E0ECW3_9ORYZ